ncbi:hypothetical protein [Pseudogracilibacillus sp. SO30301A]|uniref:hypothetical protein n=1 Tax=Pseudogracilibacillus sp. SO30301A TaxID=3098291 RepID=UPI00300DE3E7
MNTHLYKDAEQFVVDAKEEENISDEVNIESSNILFYLENNDQVEVIEELESYSFIEFIQEIEINDALSESNEVSLEKPYIWQGYIENKYLEVKLDSDITNEEDNQNEHASENEHKFKFFYARLH